MGSTKTEKESNTLSGSVISVVWLFVLFVLNSAHSSGKKNNWKCDSQEIFERKLVVNFLFHYSRKRFFMERVWQFDTIEFLSSLTVIK